MEIRKAVMAANPQVVRFDIVREGDEITVTLGFRDGPRRVDVRLLGAKTEFYRMAMGVRLDDTLASLTRADPMVEPAGVVREGDRLTLRFRYTAPDGRPRPVRAETPPPEPPPAPARPAGVEAEVTPPSPPATAPPPPAIRETPAAPPPPETPAEPPAEDPAVEAWRKALADGSLQAFERFVQKHPDAPQAPEARRRAARLREDRAYRRAVKKDDLRAYRAFLDRFPDSAHKAEVEARIQAIEAERKRREAERRAREAAEKRRLKAYDEARRMDSAEAYRIFLAAYPDAPEAKGVRRRLREIEADDAAFAKARGSEQGLSEYLARHPKGRHAGEAAKELQALRKARMEADLRAALAEGTEEALAGFLKRWPGSPHESRVREALERLRAEASAPEPAPPGPGPAESGQESADLLRAVRVAEPPRVDGQAGDPAWAGAPEIRVPLEGSPGPGALSVRAVHDGARIYLLVRWADPTRDALYRPWVWDPAQGTYHQNDQADDGLAVTIFSTPGLDDTCMLQGRGMEADLWLWRAFWSDISGLAVDARLQVSRTRLPRSNPYPARDGSGQLWVRRESDRGALGWSFFIPVEFQGAVVPSYKPSRAAGSRGDVHARGRWEEGAWTVELSRALDTKHPDDVPLAPGEERTIAFGVYDRAEKARHAVSGPVRLRLGGGR